MFFKAAGISIDMPLVRDYTVREGFGSRGITSRGNPLWLPEIMGRHIERSNV
jgi:hypothetical protein